MTTALLDAGLWHHMQDAAHLLKTHDGVFYSAAMYTERGPWPGPAAERAALTTLLRSRKCADVFYHLHGDQPPGAIGYPPHIEAAETARWQAETAHARTLAHARELEAEAAEAARRGDERAEREHETVKRRARELAGERLRIERSQHEAAMERQGDEDGARLATLGREHRLLLLHGERQVVQEQAAAEARQGRELESARRRLLQEAAFEEQKAVRSVTGLTGRGIIAL